MRKPATDKKLVAFFNTPDQVKNHTQLLAGKGPRRVYQWQLQQKTRFILDYLSERKERGRVLDVGSNVGRFSFALSDLGYSVAGIEPAKAPRRIAQAEAKKRGTKNVRFYPFALEDMAFSKKSFDVVLCIELFHHLPDDLVAFALDRFFELLKPGGLVVFDAKNADNPILAWQYKRDRRPDRPLIARPLAWFVQQAEQAGFSVIRKKGVILPASLSPWSVIVAQKPLDTKAFA